MALYQAPHSHLLGCPLRMTMKLTWPESCSPRKIKIITIFNNPRLKFKSLVEKLTETSNNTFQEMNGHQIWLFLRRGFSAVVDFGFVTLKKE